MTTRKFLLLGIIFLFFALIVIFNFRNTDKSYIEKQINLGIKLDTNKLFNLDFEYILNNDCDFNGNLSFLAVILVTSYLGNVDTRSSMRRAFSTNALEEFGIRRIFLLGLAPSDKYTKQEAIIDEQKRFGDLLQGNFIEAYRNLTYKHLMGLKWAAVNCQNAKYIIKMDDDTVLNLYKLVDLLHKLRMPRKLLAGYILSDMTPIREPANKWYITKEEYQYPFYPTFLSGWFYITNPVTVRSLVEESLKIPYFWVDDVYITGLLAQKQRVKHFNIGQYFTVHSEFLDCCLRDVTKFRYDCEIIVGPNGGDSNLFFKFNKIVSECYYKNCFKRNKSLNQTCVGAIKRTLGRGNSIIKSYQLG